MEFPLSKYPKKNAFDAIFAICANFPILITIIVKVYFYCQKFKIKKIMTQLVPNRGKQIRGKSSSSSRTTNCFGVMTKRPSIKFST